GSTPRHDVRRGPASSAIAAGARSSATDNRPARADHGTPRTTRRLLAWPLRERHLDRLLGAAAVDPHVDRVARLELVGQGALQVALALHLHVVDPDDHVSLLETGSRRPPAPPAAGHFHLVAGRQVGG